MNEPLNSYIAKKISGITFHEPLSISFSEEEIDEILRCMTFEIAHSHNEERKEMLKGFEMSLSDRRYNAKKESILKHFN
jgi:hypothetical protein